MTWWNVFKTHREEYYDRLQRVRLYSEWDGWLTFFFEGVREVAQRAFRTARTIVRIVETDRVRIGKLGRKTGSALQIHDALRRNPITTAADLHAKTALSLPTVNGVLASFVTIGLVREVSGRRRNRVFVYDEYLRALSDEVG